MKRLMGIAGGVVVLAFWSVTARTPAELVQQFDAVLPAGSEAQAVWAERDGKLYVVRSTDGIVNALNTTNAVTPQIVSDGAKIVYANSSSGSLMMINWDGSEPRTVSSGNAGSLEDYYKDPQTGTEYVITYSGGSVRKFNIANGSSSSLPGSPGDDGVRITPDGKYYAADIDGDQHFGFTAIPGGQTTTFCPGGTCNCNASPDNTYRMMIQYAGHNAVYVCRHPTLGSGTEYKTSPKNITSSVRATYPRTTSPSCSEVVNDNGYGFESTRWIASDYVTMIMTYSTANPVLVKLSDPTKWVALKLDQTCQKISQGFMCTACDARIYTATSVLNSGVSRIDLKTPHAVQELFSPNGRRLASSPAIKGGSMGLVIRRVSSNGAVVSKLEVVH